MSNDNIQWKYEIDEWITIDSFIGLFNRKYYIHLFISDISDQLYRNYIDNINTNVHYPPYGTEVNELFAWFTEQRSLCFVPRKECIYTQAKQGYHPDSKTHSFRLGQHQYISM